MILLKNNLLRLQILLLMALALQACGAANALKRADTTEQRAYAAYGEFVIVAEQTAKLIASGRLSDRTIVRLGQIEDAAKLVADPLLDLINEFEVIKAEYEVGGVGEAQYINAMNNLNNWIERLLPLTANLLSATKGVQR